MATITSDTFLDGGTARTAGEAWTCNGGRLTIRTDSRWHANAPASMTGSLGALTVSSTLGGGYTIDGRNVRWMAYDGGSGTVPAIGTTITGGTSGATGYLLGVWASTTAAPTAVAAAMPATGFLKFREVTGAFVDNDVLSGITATANGVDKVGWIEVVHDQSIAITIPRLGDMTVRGDWFEIGTTSGAANQLMQVPTNGSSTTYVPGVWVETAVGADTYEFWPAVYAAGFITTNFGTDDRSKFVCMETNGNVRFGHNGTGAVGKVPAANLRVRVPNVFLRHCTTAARATNVLPSSTLGTRPDFVTTSAGAIDWENCMCDWYVLFAQPYSVRLVNFATFDTINISECATALEFDSGGIGTSQGALDINALALTSNFAGGTLQSFRFDRFTTGANDHAVALNNCIGQSFYDCKAGIITYARTASGVAWYGNLCSNLFFSNITQLNGQTTLNTCTNILMEGIDHCDRYVGATSASSGIYVVSTTGACNGITVNGVTFGIGGAIANCHPYSGLFNSAACSNLKFRNIGSRGAMLNGGSAQQPGYIYVSGGNNVNVKLQRIYMQPTRSGAISTLNSDKGMLYEHVYGDFADTIAVADLNSVLKNCGGTNTTTGQASTYGTHFWDAFTSDTAGRVILSFNEPTVETASLYTVVAGTPKFTSAGGLVMAASGDEIIIEQPYFVKGCTALANTTPTVTGTNVTYVSGPDFGNHDIYYTIDTGAGFDENWLALTGANLSAVTISPDVGFRMRYLISCDGSSTTNLVSYIRIDTVSTLTAQTNNLYPLDTVNVTLTGLVAGSEIRVYEDTGSENGDAVDGIESSGTEYTFAALGGTTVNIMINNVNYLPADIWGYVVPSTDASIPVKQFTDRNYGNPA
jgi:hypothetical protein